MNLQILNTVIISGIPSGQKVTCADLQDLIEKHCGTTYACHKNHTEVALTQTR